MRRAPRTPGRECNALRRAAVLLCVLACALATGTVAGAAPAPTTVTLITVTNMLHTPEFVAVEKGFFLKHGLNVKFIHTQTGAEANAAMESGSAQFSDTGVTSVQAAREAGLKMFMAVPVLNDATTEFGDSPIAVVARADSGIKPDDARSFTGKKVGLVRGGTADVWLTTWLTKQGVDLAKVAYLNVEPGSQLVTIQNRNVDAIATWEPFQTQILDVMGPQAVLIKRGGPILGYILGIGATEAYAQGHGAVIQAMSDAIAETQFWIRTHLDDAADVVTHWIPGLTPKVASAAIKNIPFDPRVSGCTYRAFAAATQLLYQQHKIKALMPAEEQLTDSYVKQTQALYPGLVRDLKPIPASCGR
jgi:ABC-type nitrate/sulfonate/bicarbonate transport system substrate-binding protein